MMLAALAEKAALWAARRRAILTGTVAASDPPAPQMDGRTRQAHAGRAYPRNVTYKDIAGEDEVRLVLAYQQGDRSAGEVLLRAHAGAIESWTKKTAKWSKLDVDECRQEASMGFLHAVKIFDPTRGAKLNTMAIHWVRQAVERYAQNTARTIRLPVHEQVAVKKERQGREHYVMQNGKRVKVTPSMEARRAYSLHLPSLDAPVGDEDGATFGQIIPDVAASPEDVAVEYNASRVRAALIEDALATLSDREREVLRRRRLNDEEETLEEIGASVGLSRERIRQIEAKALDKVRGRLMRSGAMRTADELWSDG